MGNQPSRKTTKRKSSAKRPLKIIKSAKSSVEKNQFTDAAKKVIGGGLKETGTGILAASLFAGINAYNKLKEEKTGDIQKITRDSVNQIIRSQNLKIPNEGRTILRSSILTALSKKWHT